MSYKTLAIHLDDSPAVIARIDLAGRLAQRHGSRLVGIAPTGLPDVILSMSSAAPDGMECIPLSASYLRDKAERVAAAFEKRCRETDVSAFESRVVVDEAVDGVVRHGRCSDLVVLGQADPTGPIDGVGADFPQQVLLHGGPPVLLVPYAGRFTTLGRRVLVAWKDTREAARALRDALPLLRECEHATLLEVGEGAAAEGDDESLQAAGRWLAAHGVGADLRREADVCGAANQLLSRAADLGADLLVAGGYGHSRLREWVLGGVTRHLLKHMTVPILMSH